MGQQIELHPDCSRRLFDAPERLAKRRSLCLRDVPLQRLANERTLVHVQ